MSSTITAIATPLAIGGVSMIRISGDDALSIADKVFKALNKIPLKELEGYRASYGSICNEEGKQIDDAVALVYKAPKSYTGEDVVEISCHGGVYITREVLRLIVIAGARIATAGEFSKRAFLNGKMSLTQAESVMDLINSQNAQSMKSARAQMDGALHKKIEYIKGDLLNVAGHLSAWVDFPEEDIEVVEDENLKKSLTEAKAVVDELVTSFNMGKIVREGVRTAIVGKPNVGKSTLMNLLSGCQKSIVTDIAGTTRDVIEESVSLENVVLRLADTAGIRTTDDKVEKQGVLLAFDRIDTAGLVLAVFDNSVKLEDNDFQIIDKIKKSDTPAIAIVNKSDLESNLEIKIIQDNFTHIVYTSNENTDSLKELSVKIEEVLDLNKIDTASGIIANDRQYYSAVKTQEYLQEAIDTHAMGFTLDAVTVSIESAIESLLELTGERVSEKVVDQVFHNFCVGK